MAVKEVVLGKQGAYAIPTDWNKVVYFEVKDANERKVKLVAARLDRIVIGTRRRNTGLGSYAEDWTSYVFRLVDGTEKAYGTARTDWAKWFKVWGPRCWMSKESYKRAINGKFFQEPELLLDDYLYHDDLMRAIIPVEYGEQERGGMYSGSSFLCRWKWDGCKAVPVRIKCEGDIVLTKPTDKSVCNGACDCSVTFVDMPNTYATATECEDANSIDVVEFDDAIETRWNEEQMRDRFKEYVKSYCSILEDRIVWDCWDSELTMEENLEVQVSVWMSK